MGRDTMTAFMEVDASGRRGFANPSASALAHDVDTLDFSGWPIYANASLPDAVAYDVCAALAAREAEIPWENGTSETALQMVQ